MVRCGDKGRLFIIFTILNKKLSISKTSNEDKCNVINCHQITFKSLMFEYVINYDT